jgi:CDP-diacylglycerol--serine O-phosphatidyltransferase
MNLRRHLPNVLTLGNLFAGIWAIIFAFRQDYEMSAYLVCISAIADFFDGMLARILKTDGELGKQLDSLADVVSFGLAPALTLWNLGMQTEVGIAVHAALFIPLFTALRLAKFNIDPDQSTSFKGLPSPAAGLAVIALVAGIESSQPLQVMVLNPAFYLLLSIASSWLMVSSLKMFSLKMKKFSVRAYPLQSLLIALAPLWVIIFKLPGISLTILSYVILSIVHTFALSKSNS